MTHFPRFGLPRRGWPLARPCALIVLAGAALSVTHVEPCSAGPLVSVYVDCYLSTHLKCPTVQKSWRSLVPTVLVGKRENAEVIVKVRSWARGPQDQYQLRFEAKKPLPSFTLEDAQLLLPRSMPPLNARLALDRQFLRGLTLYHELEKYEVLGNGNIQTVLAGNGPSNAAPQADREGVFAFTGLGMESFGAEPTRIGMFSWASVGFDHPDWLFESWYFVNAQYVRQELDDRIVEGENLRLGTGVMGSRSFAGHFASALLLRGRRDPSANWRSRLQAHTGIEYELMPILEENDSAFTVNYLVGGDYERYRYRNVNYDYSAWVPTHALSFFFLHHLDSFDVKAFGSVTSVLDEPERYALGGLGEATAYPTPDFAVSLVGSVGFRDKAINAPADPDDIPEGVRMLGAVSGITPLTYRLGVKVSYAFGASLLRERDARWKFSDLDIGF